MIFFYNFIGFRLGNTPSPQIPLVKCEYIYFCTYMHIWIDVGENMSIFYLFIMLKIVDFKVDNDKIWNAQNASFLSSILDPIIFIQHPGPPSKNVIHIITSGI